MVVVYIGIGSNHAAENNLKQGINLLKEKFTVTAISPVYESAPVDNDSAPSYLNAVVSTETDLAPENIKQILVKIEDETGRIRTDAEGNKSKLVSLDLDILLYGDAIILYDFNQKSYRLPDGNIVNHAHIAIPLAHIAGDVVHPDTKQSILTIAANFSAHTMTHRDDVL